MTAMVNKVVVEDSTDDLQEEIFPDETPSYLVNNQAKIAKSLKQCLKEDN